MKGGAVARPQARESRCGALRRCRYREKFSDYGARRQTAVQYHLDQLERLLKPTQVTRMGMWCLHQDDSFYQENSLDPEGGTTMWHFLCNELKVTEEQQRKIKQYRNKVRDLSEGLRNTMDLLEELRGRAQVKNVALDQAMHDLQGILTPTQSAKVRTIIRRPPPHVVTLTRCCVSARFALRAVPGHTSRPPHSSFCGSTATRCACRC